MLKKQGQTIFNEILEGTCGKRVRFKYLFKLFRGLNITKIDLIDSGVPCVSYGEIHSRYGFEVSPDTHTLPYVNKKYLETNLKSLMSYGDFVFADTSEDIVGSGNFTYLNSTIPVFAGYHTIVAKPNKIMNYRYLAYYFDSLVFREQIQQSVSGVKVYSITQRILNNTFIVLPPTDKQEQIVRYLDRKVSMIDKYINAKKKQTELLKELLSRRITDLLIGNTDTSLKMKHLAERRLQYGANASGVVYNEKYPRYIRITDIKKDGTLKDNDILSLDIPGYDEYLLTDGDILFARSGATVGKSFLYKDEYGKSCFAGYLIRITPNRKIVLPEYLYYFTLSATYGEWLKRVFIQATIQNISAEKYKELPVPYTSLEKQRKLISVIQHELKNAKIYTKNIDAEIKLLQEYRTRLISDAVTGKIDVQRVKIPQFFIDDCKNDANIARSGNNI